MMEIRKNLVRLRYIAFLGKFNTVVLFGNEEVDIPSYVRDDNADVSHRVYSINPVTYDKRLCGYL